MNTVRLAKLAIVPLLAVALGACGSASTGNGIASGGGTATTSPTGSPSTGDDQERARQFANCMRENGVDMPDPVGPGEPVRIEEPPTGAAADRFKEAMAKCRQYAPNNGDMPALSAAELEKMRNYARCIRENGLTDFPDPDPNSGGIIAEYQPGAADSLSPDNPVFQQAHKACQHHIATGDDGRITVEDGGQR
jgi:hypothetical protein